MTDLTTRRTALLAYAQSCLDAGDYHGCRDACTDLEVIEARLEERAGRTEPVYDPRPMEWHPMRRSGVCPNCGNFHLGSACQLPPDAGTHG